MFSSKFIFFVSVTCKVGMCLGWFLYLVVCPNIVISSNWIGTWSFRCSNCKCCIDLSLTFPVLSCMLKALLESHTNSIARFIFNIKCCSQGIVFSMRPYILPWSQFHEGLWWGWTLILSCLEIKSCHHINFPNDIQMDPTLFACPYI